MSNSYFLIFLFFNHIWLLLQDLSDFFFHPHLERVDNSIIILSIDLLLVSLKQLLRHFVSESIITDGSGFLIPNCVSRSISNPNDQNEKEVDTSHNNNIGCEPPPEFVSSSERLLSVGAFHLNEKLGIPIPTFLPVRPFLAHSIIHPKVKVDVTRWFSETLSLNVPKHVLSVNRPFAFLSFVVLLARVKVLSVVRGYSKIMNLADFPSSARENDSTAAKSCILAEGI